MNAPQINPAPAPAPAAGKGKGNAKGAKGAAKPKRYVVLGAEGVAAIDLLCASIEKTVGFKPTQAQVVLRLIAQAQAAEAAKATADAANEPVQG